MEFRHLKHFSFARPTEEDLEMSKGQERTADRDVQPTQPVK